MSEGKLLSKRQVAERIGAHQKTKSEVNWQGFDCLPTAVAFTHGYTSEEAKLGITAMGVVQQAVDASKELAERYGEATENDLFVLSDDEDTRKRITQNLGKSEKAWIFYGNGDKSHALGVLRIDDDQFVLANVEGESDFLTASGDQIADLLTGYSKITELGTYIVGFRKK